jgi:hypothetical protein
VSQITLGGTDSQRIFVLNVKRLKQGANNMMVTDHRCATKSCLLRNPRSRFVMRVDRLKMVTDHRCGTFFANQRGRWLRFVKSPARKKHSVCCAAGQSIMVRCHAHHAQRVQHVQLQRAPSACAAPLLPFSQSALSGRIMYMNHDLATTLGYTAKQVVGRLVCWLVSVGWLVVVSIGWLLWSHWRARLRVRHAYERTHFQTYEHTYECAVPQIVKMDISQLMAPPYAQLHYKYMKEPPAKVPLQSCR